MTGKDSLPPELTLLANFNRDTLSPDEATSVFGRLLHWYVRLVNAGDATIVTRKLCSSLVAYYLRPSITWRHCVKHVIISLPRGAVPVDYHSGPLDEAVSAAIANLDGHSMVAILWFTAGIADAVRESSAVDKQLHGYYVRVADNIEDIIAVIGRSMDAPSDTKSISEGLKCFHSLVTYAQRASLDKALDFKVLQPLTHLAIQHLHCEETRSVASELFTDILVTFPNFLTPANIELLSMVFVEGKEQVLALKEGDFHDEALDFLRLLLALGEFIIQDIATKWENPVMSLISRYLLELLTCSGYEGSEYGVIAQV